MADKSLSSKNPIAAPATGANGKAAPQVTPSDKSKAKKAREPRDNCRGLATGESCGDELRDGLSRRRRVCRLAFGNRAEDERDLALWRLEESFRELARATANDLLMPLRQLPADGNPAFRIGGGE